MAPSLTGLKKHLDMVGFMKLCWAGQELDFKDPDGSLPAQDIL